MVRRKFKFRHDDEQVTKPFPTLVKMWEVLPALY